MPVEVSEIRDVSVLSGAFVVVVSGPYGLVSGSSACWMIFCDFVVPFFVWMDYDGVSKQRER